MEKRSDVIQTIKSFIGDVPFNLLEHPTFLSVITEKDAEPLLFDKDGLPIAKGYIEMNVEERKEKTLIFQNKGGAKDA